MKIILMTFGVLITIMVYSAAAGPSTNAAPKIDMDLLEEDACRVCHDGTSYLRNTDHYILHFKTDYNSCSEITNCHNPTGPKKLDCMKSGCHNSGSDNAVTNHHDFAAIFDKNGDGSIDDEYVDWNCFYCHEKGTQR